MGYLTCNGMDCMEGDKMTEQSKEKEPITKFSNRKWKFLMVDEKPLTK